MNHCMAAGSKLFLRLSIAAWLAAAAAAEPTPSSGTLGPGDPPMTWTGGNISGVNVTEETCIENTTCETFTLNLAAGDYSGTQLAIEIHWPHPRSDYALIVREGDERFVSDGTFTTSESEAIRLEPGPQERVFAIRVLVAGEVIPGDKYSGTAFLQPAPDPDGDCSLNNNNPDDEYAPALLGLCEIPVFLHVLMSESGAGAFSDLQIQDQIDALNRDFSGLPDPNHTDAGVRFRLAGVTRTKNDFWFQELPDPNKGNYWDTLARDPHRFLNIYTNNAQAQTNFGGTSRTGDGPHGLSAGCHPAQCGGAGSRSDRVIILHTTFGSERTVPLNAGTHEAGHYLGLLHPFDRDNASCEIPDPSEPPPDCHTTGDLICDTPRMYDSLAGGAAGTCDVDPMQCGDPDPIHNYMNYLLDPCANQFTPEQAKRMRCTLTHYRPLVCSAVASADRKVSGGGQLTGDVLFDATGNLLSLPAIVASPSGSGAQAQFAFAVQDGVPATGHLNYRDQGNGLEIKATSLEALALGAGSCGPNSHATFTGTASVNGAEKSFEVQVEDCGEPGAGRDSFQIRILESGGYQNGGALISGNVQIQ